MGIASLLCLAAATVAAAALISAAAAESFTCNAAPTATCQGLIEYIPTNATTLAAVQSLFQVPHLSLLAANNLPTTTSSSRRVPAGSTTRVPFPCRCAAGKGTSDGVPIYIVKAGDNLDAIARNDFEALVTYQNISAVNAIPDPSKIVPGQRLRIPLPCSCDPVAGSAVAHLGHVVAAGSSVEAIAAEFGTDNATLLKLNGIADPKSLQAGQLLDVPLRACSSSFNDSSMDKNLLVPNNSYALTANDCILCSCNSSQSQLDCKPTKGLSSLTCPAASCGPLSIGNTSTSGCDQTTCSYAGYTNATTTTKFTIFVANTTQSTCSSNGGATRLGLVKSSNWAGLLIMLNMALLSFWHI